MFNNSENERETKLNEILNPEGSPVSQFAEKAFTVICNKKFLPHKMAMCMFIINMVNLPVKHFKSCV